MSSTFENQLLHYKPYKSTLCYKQGKCTKGSILHTIFIPNVILQYVPTNTILKIRPPSKHVDAATMHLAS